MVDGSDNPSFVMLAQPSVVGNDLYFLGTNAQGYEFYQSDGTLAGTVGLMSFSFARKPTVTVTGANGKVFFTWNDNVNSGLMVTDGTVAGTHDLAIIQTNTAALGFVSLNNNVFVGIQDVTGSQSGLFSVGATSLTKVMGFPSGMGPVTVFGPAMYFMGSDASAGSELWKSDGTVGGTARLVDIVPGPDSSGPQCAYGDGEQAAVLGERSDVRDGAARQRWDGGRDDVIQGHRHGCRTGRCSGRRA